MNRVQQYFRNLVDRIREHVKKPNLHPEGPHSSPAYMTVKAMTWTSDTLQSLKEVFSNLTADYKQAFCSLSILTLVVEHFFSSMRDRYTMPYLLHYAQLLMPTIQETVKKLTNASFIHYMRRTAYYLDPAASVRYANLKWPEKSPVITVSPHDLQLLQEWQRQYCGGVRQWTVRDISKLFAIISNAEETSQAEVTHNITRFQGQQAEEDNETLVTVEEHSSTPVLFKKGVFLAVKPGFKINALSHVSKANFYIVVTESDVLDNPNETAVAVMWFSGTETTGEEFGCFVAVESGTI